MVDAEKLALDETRAGWPATFKINFSRSRRPGGAGRAVRSGDARRGRRPAGDRGDRPGGLGPGAARRCRCSTRRASSRSRRARATPASRARSGPASPSAGSPSGRAHARAHRRRRRRPGAGARGPPPRRRAASPRGSGRAGARRRRRRARRRDARRAGASSSRTPAAPTPSSTRGDDPDNAVGGADDVAPRAPRPPDRAPGRADPRRDRRPPGPGRAPRRRARLSAPEPGSSPELRALRGPLRRALRPPARPYARDRLRGDALRAGRHRRRRRRRAPPAGGNRCVLRRGRAARHAARRLPHRPARALAPARSPSGCAAAAPSTWSHYDSSVASRVISPTPARARETMQSSFAAVAVFWNASRPGPAPGRAW